MINVRNFFKITPILDEKKFIFFIKVSKKVMLLVVSKYFIITNYSAWIKLIIIG